MKLTKSIIQHPQWGTIIVTRNPRARHIILRSRPDGIHVTVPTFATQSEIEKAITECIPKLIQKKPQNNELLIDTSYSIESDNFIFRVAEHSAKVFQIKYYGKEVLLLCPANTCYNEEKVQQWLRKAVTTAITRRAKAFLPVRLKQLATEKGFTYNSCTIRNVHSRWGSCSTRGNISLSIYLMLLPDKLMDYVLLHELCHTVEMNHSEKFWALMDRTVAPAKAKDLRKMLKAYKTNF